MTPVSSSANGEVAENIEWREDLSCGPAKLNSIGTPAKCNQPYTGDPMRDLARCCRTDKCNVDFECSCPACTQFMSLDDDHEHYELVNQHSVHVGIVTFWPIFYGFIEEDSVLENLLSLLEDPQGMLSQYGVRSLSARDQFYGPDQGTYRGNLFVHFHYMLLRGLKLYFSD